MKLPRPAFPIGCAVLAAVLVLGLFPAVSRGAALQISPSMVNGDNAAGTQFTVTGGVSPYTWSSTVGSVTSGGAWSGAGPYGDTAAYHVYSVVTTIPENSPAYRNCPVINGVQYVTGKGITYSYRGLQVGYTGYTGCRLRSAIQYWIDAVSAYGQSYGNPPWDGTGTYVVDVRPDWIKQAGGRPCALDGFQSGVVTVTDSTGAAASAQINLCSPDPNRRPEPVAEGDPAYKKKLGCPIHVDNGNMFTDPQRDLYIPGRGLPLEFSRMYNSRSTDQLHMGYGWNHTYDRSLAVLPGDAVKIVKPDGSWIFFEKTADGSYTPLYGEKTTVEKLSGGYYVHREKDGTAYLFEPLEGHLLSITDPNGNSLQLTYADGLLSAVTDPEGRSLRFTYNSRQQVDTVADPAGRLFRYSYDGNGNLTQVTYPDGTARTYQYADPNDAHNLTAILDENGHEVESHTYDDQDRALTSCKEGCRESVRLSFDGPGQTTATDALGNRTVYRYDLKTGAILSEEESDGTATRYTWDDQLNLISVTDRRGYTRSYTYDGNGNVISETDSGGAVTEFTYETTYNHPTSRTEPATESFPPGTTQFVYDLRGNLVRVVGPLGETTALAYDSQGQLTEIDGPRTDVPDVTRFSYDSYGNLATITDPLGHETQFRYDLLGNLLSVVDPNGNGTEYTYDLRGRPSQIAQPDGGTIRNTYDPAGNLIVLTSPRGNSVQMTYNPVNQLLEMRDPLGNAITNTYDIEGRRTGRALSDSGGGITARTDFGYDSWHRLTSVTESDGAATLYAYDPEGNRTARTDPNGNTTRYEYDGNNRLVKVTDPAGGITSYAYDARGNLTRVTDPQGSVTTYVYDGSNRLIRADSPDAGITAYEYDPAGNLTRKTDGRGIVSAYAYDALNRLTAVSFPDPAENIAYRYDQGTNGVGRLTGLTDPAGATAFSYDPMGRLTGESFTADGVTAATRYAYDLNGNLTAITLPSGRLVEYAYDEADRLEEVAAAVGGSRQVLASSFSYLPFGPWSTMTQGNGLTTTGDYDQRYQLVNYGVGTNTLSFSYAYDPAGNITAIVDDLQPQKTRRFGYDVSDRLLYGEGIWGTLDYQYDPAGNRIRETRNGAVTDYTYQGNRLTGMNGAQPRSLAYDGAGNATQEAIPSGTADRVYSQNGRMIRALAHGTVMGEYRYDALGRRRVKTAGGQTTYFHYGPSGHLLSETDSRGNFLVDYLWAGDQLLALVTPRKLTTVTARVQCTPGTLNLKNEKGWLRCRIGLPSPYLPQDVDLQGVRLNDTVPAVYRRPSPARERDRDRARALLVRFSRQEMAAILSPGKRVPLTLTGMVSGTPFSGTTTIRVIAPGKKHEEERREE